MLDLPIDDCEEIRHEGIPHFVPKGDCEEHSIPKCRCGAIDLSLGEHRLAVLHFPFDKRDLVDAILVTDSLSDAKEFREEFHAHNKDLFLKGKIQQKDYLRRW